MMKGSYMAFHHAKRLNRYQKGISLVEMMIASAIGLIILMAVVSVFISNQKIAIERSQKLLVLQSINDAMRYIKDDIRRAGFHGDSGRSYTLSGAESVIEVTSTSLTYGYQTHLSGTVPMYKQMSFIYRPHKKEVRVCDRAELTVQRILPCGTKKNPSFSLFDEKRINVDRFEIERQNLGSAVSSALYTITMKASLLDGSHPQTLSTQIKQRNWN